MQMVGADWLISDKREDDLGSRVGGIVQVWTVILCFMFRFIKSDPCYYSSMQNKEKLRIRYKSLIEK